jgi:predicted GNAT family acetyltransferase
MIGAFLNLSRPLAMQALSNPRILGSLLVGAVGSQQANEITNQLKLGNISLDNVYDTIINFASSPAVSIIDEMQTTPSGEVYAPDQEQIDAERKFNEELNKKITTASETPKADILITPDVQEQFEPLITLPPEFKEIQGGFTPAPEVKPSDYIMKSEEKKTDLKPNEKIFNQIAGVKNQNIQRDPNDLFAEGWENKMFPMPKQIGTLGEYQVAIDVMKRSDNNFLLFKDGKVHATIELANTMGQDNVIDLDAIGVPVEMQGQGIAKDVLNELFKLADENGVTIQGTAQPFGSKTLNTKQLVKFYNSMGFEGDANNLVRKPVIAKEESSPKQPLGADVTSKKTQILSGPEFITNATKLKDTKVKIPDVLEYLDSGKKRDIFNEEDYKAMLDEGLQEINYQLQQEVTGEGWYDEGVKKAMDIAPKINPKFADNPDLKDLLLFTTAIASSGVNVGSDFKVGLQVADIFADTGQIPLTNPKTGSGWTVRGSNLAKQLNLANNYIQKNGLPAFLEFMHSEVQGRDIQDFRKEYGNLGPSKGVRMEEYYSGHRAFGPKIGEFMANLYGVDDNNVTDMWNIRGMNRLMGGSMYVRNKDGKILSNKDGTVMENTGSPTKEFKIVFDKYMTDLSNLIGKSVRDTQAIRWYLEQGLYTALGVRSVPKDYGTAAQEVLDQKLKTESDGTIRSSETSNIKGTPPTKKAQGGSISIPQRRSLVNDGLVDINTVIGKLNYGR